MAKVKVHAGDWAKGGEHSFSFGVFSLRKDGGWLHETVPARSLASIDVASEENVKRLGGAAGWATVGAVALGPLGLVAGLLLGGNKKEVTFVAEFDDGRRMLATTESKAFTQMQAAVFDTPRSSAIARQLTTSQTKGPKPSSADRSLAKELRDQVADMLTEDEADAYELLLAAGRDEEANDFFSTCLENEDIRNYIDTYCFTEEEARHFSAILLDESKSAEVQAMTSEGFERKRARESGIGSYP